MRILLNRNERAMIEEQAKSHNDKVMFCQIGLVLNQPMEKISSWAQKLATADSVARIHARGVMPIIMGPRPDSAPLEPEPGMGSIMVVSLPDSHDLEATHAMQSSILYQRMADYYGATVMNKLHDAADWLVGSEDACRIISTDDPDTPIAIVLQAPNEMHGDLSVYKELLRENFEALFETLGEIERGELTIDSPYYNGKLPPRSLDRRMIVDGKPVVARVCGLGYDIEMLLNGGVARDDDETLVVEFWNAFQAYLDLRPTDPAAFKGFWQPESNDLDAPVDLPTEAAND